eukprot:scaffold47844_cov36-Phaeocystis_antarctica.AAC.1
MIYFLSGVTRKQRGPHAAMAGEQVQPVGHTAGEAGGRKRRAWTCSYMSTHGHRTPTTQPLPDTRGPTAHWWRHWVTLAGCWRSLRSTCRGISHYSPLGRNCADLCTAVTFVFGTSIPSTPTRCRCRLRPGRATGCLRDACLRDACLRNACLRD